MSDSNKSELVFVKVEFESPVKEDLENIKREDHLSIKTEGGMHFLNDCLFSLRCREMKALAECKDGGRRPSYSSSSSSSR